MPFIHTSTAPHVGIFQNQQSCWNLEILWVHRKGPLGRAPKEISVCFHYYTQKSKYYIFTLLYLSDVKFSHSRKRPQIYPPPKVHSCQDVKQVLPPTIRDIKQVITHIFTLYNWFLSNLIPYYIITSSYGRIAHFSTRKVSIISCNLQKFFKKLIVSK